MLQTYTGTPGSGKSYHIVDDMISHLKIGGVVVTNLELDLKNILKYHPKLTQKDLDERLIILPNELITPKLLYNLSFQHKNNPYGCLLLMKQGTCLTHENGTTQTVLLGLSFSECIVICVITAF